MKICKKKRSINITFFKEKLTQNMYVQKCSCLEGTACYHAISTEEKMLTSDTRKQFISLHKQDFKNI